MRFRAPAERILSIGLDLGIGFVGLGFRVCGFKPLCKTHFLHRAGLGLRFEG